jgi:predicted transcriptional regulator
MNPDKLYSFVFRGLLTEEALDKSGRQTLAHIDGIDLESLRDHLSVKYLDQDFLAPAIQMSMVYAAIAAFENSVRSLVKKTLLEKFEAEWWENGVSEGIRKKAESRHKEEQKIKWHSTRGNDFIAFTDFGQLNSVIVSNWALFEDLLQRQQWVQHIFDTMERSRNGFFVDSCGELGFEV